MGLKIGEKAPNFTLDSTSGKEFTLYDSVGNEPCIIYFYPKDFTSVCTEQACSFRDEFGAFRDLGVTVIGISKDDIETHNRFKKEYNLPFELLADTKGKVAKLYDSLLPIVSIPKRNTFVLAGDKTIMDIQSDLTSGKSKIREVVENLTKQF
ncbi:peroxiredoxin [Bernardetia sp. OM2101]|uniref:peroxiredoxin n=1 Tax=Bernardetia sp. OM2101 TaxID=3344876 RepID=UPI0035CFC64D